jgi:hypothetical protein
MNGIKGLVTILAIGMAVLVVVMFGSNEPSVTYSDAVEPTHDSSEGVNVAPISKANLGYQDDSFDAALVSYCTPVSPFTQKSDFQQAFLYGDPNENWSFYDCDGIRRYLPVPTKSGFESIGFAYLTVDSIEDAWRSFEKNGVDIVSQPRVVHHVADRNLWMAFFNDADGNTAAIMSEVSTSA